MGRSSFCDKTGLKRGMWTPEEDRRLSAYIRRYGHWNWREIPKFAGLSRCGKSCRLRWMNYLRPNIKRGNYTREEEELILSLHQKLGNRWSAIAAKLPGRTDNEIKNHWHTHLKKRSQRNSKPMEMKIDAVDVSESERELESNTCGQDPLCPTILESSSFVWFPQEKIISDISSPSSESSNFVWFPQDKMISDISSLSSDCNSGISHNLVSDENIFEIFDEFTGDLWGESFQVDSICGVSSSSDTETGISETLSDANMFEWFESVNGNLWINPIQGADSIYGVSSSSDTKTVTSESLKYDSIFESIEEFIGDFRNQPFPVPDSFVAKNSTSSSHDPKHVSSPPLYSFYDGTDITDTDFFIDDLDLARELPKLF